MNCWRSLKVLICYFLASGILSSFDVGSYFKSGLRGGSLYQISDLFMGLEDRPLHGASDVTKKPVLDIVPFRTARRKVRDSDHQTAVIGKALQILFEKMAAIRAASATVGEHNQFAAARIVEAPPPVPPQPETIDGESRAFVAFSHDYHAAVFRDVVNSERRDFAFGKEREIVIPTHQLAVLVMRPEFSFPVNAAQKLLLLAVDAHHRHSPSLSVFDKFDNDSELLIAVGTWVYRLLFDRFLERVVFFKSRLSV